MIKISKIAYLYLSIFIAALVSMTLPEPLYMAIIFVMNLSVAITLISRSPNQPIVSQISLFLLISSTLAFNVWAAFQTVSYFIINPGTFLTLSIYLVIYYLLAMITLKPSFIIKSIIFITEFIKIPFSSKKSAAGFTDVTEIHNLLTASCQEKLELRVKFNSIFVGDFTIFNVDENKMQINPSDALLEFTLKNPTSVLYISFMLDSQNYSFTSKVISLQPLLIKLPNEVLRVNAIPSLEEIKEDNVERFDPSSITTAIKTGTKNIEISLSELTTSSLKFTTDSIPLITFLNTSSEYININLFVSGSLIEVQALMSGKRNEDNGYTYDAELKNTNKEIIKLIKELIN